MKHIFSGVVHVKEISSSFSSIVFVFLFSSSRFVFYPGFIFTLLWNGCFIPMPVLVNGLIGSLGSYGSWWCFIPSIRDKSQTLHINVRRSKDNCIHLEVQCEVAKQLF